MHGMANEEAYIQECMERADEMARGYVDGLGESLDTAGRKMEDEGLRPGVHGRGLKRKMRWRERGLSGLAEALVERLDEADTSLNSMDVEGGGFHPGVHDRPEEEDAMARGQESESFGQKLATAGVRLNGFEGEGGGLHPRQ